GIVAAVETGAAFTRGFAHRGARSAAVDGSVAVDDEAAPLAAGVGRGFGVVGAGHDHRRGRGAVHVNLGAAVDHQEVEASFAVDFHACVDGQLRAVGVVAADEHAAGQDVLEIVGQVNVGRMGADHHAKALAARNRGIHAV